MIVDRFVGDNIFLCQVLLLLIDFSIAKLAGNKIFLQPSHFLLNICKSVFCLKGTVCQDMG